MQKGSEKLRWGQEKRTKDGGSSNADKSVQGAARNGGCPCKLGRQGYGKSEGCSVLRVEAALKKSGENDRIRFELWRRCVEKLGRGLKAAGI